MRIPFLIAALIPLISHLALANVEKVIFLGPAPTPFERRHELDVLRLDHLSPAYPLFRTQLPAAFPSQEWPDGKESWWLLDGLVQDQRYELRICWLATVG